MTKYGIAGVASVVANLFTIYVLTSVLGIWYSASAFFAYIAAITTSFLLQKLWTFEDRSWHKGKQQASLYSFFSIINLGLNLVLLYVAVELLHMWYFTAQIGIAAIIAAESFLLSSFVIFRQDDETDSDEQMGENP